MKLAILKVPALNPKDGIFASEQKNESTHLWHILKDLACIIDLAGYISFDCQNPQTYNMSNFKKIIRRK